MEKSGLSKNEGVLMTEEKSKWVKYGAIFAIIIMLGSGVLAVSMLLDDSAEPTEYPLKNIKGQQTDFTFKNAKDGVKYLPAGVLSVNILKIYPDDEISESLSHSFPGIVTDKVMLGSYKEGMIEYYSVKENNNGSIVVQGKPTYDKYGGYDMIRVSPAQRAIIGDPLIIASFFNYSKDSTLGKRVIDVLNGDASGATDLNDILAYADDVDNFDEIIAYKANAGSDYDKYYQRSSQSGTGILQMEAIILSPDDSVKESVSAFSNNASESVTVAVMENGPALKIYITSSDYIGFLTKTNELYKLISTHTVQSNSTA